MVEGCKTVEGYKRAVTGWRVTEVVTGWRVTGGL